MSAQELALLQVSRPLSLRPARSSMLLAWLARIPTGGLSLMFIMAVRESGFSFALAGVTSGACAIGIAVSAPLSGRLADRIGQTPVLYASAGATATTMLVFGTLPRAAPEALLPVLALCCGLALPPTSSSARVVWRSLLPAAAFERIVTLDATLQELAFLMGPLLMLGLAARTSAHTVLAMTGFGWALLTVKFGSLAETRGVKGARVAAGRSWAGPIRYSSVRIHLFVAVALGSCVGATEIGLITLMQDSHARGWLSLVYAIWALSSAAGGLLAMRCTTGGPSRRLLFLLIVCTLSTAALALATGPVSLAILLPFAGVGFAPVFGLQLSALGAVTPAGMATEAYGLYAAAITVGTAMGTALGGELIGIGTYRGAFIGAAMFMALGAVGFGVSILNGRRKVSKLS